MTGIGFSFLFFNRIAASDWSYVGDTLNTQAVYYYYYSSILRGELPGWMPLIRTGEPLFFQYIINNLGNPLLNLTVVLGVILGIKNTTLCFAAFIFLLIAAYCSGIYFLLRAWGVSRAASSWGALLALGSSTVYFHYFHCTFLLMVYTVPWILYSLVRYFREYQLRHLLLLALMGCLALYSYEIFVPGAYGIMMAISAAVIFHKSWVGWLRSGPKPPFRHVLVFLVLIAIFAVPAGLLVMEYSESGLPISRITQVSVGKNMEMVFDEDFKRIYGDRFFTLLDYGRLGRSWEETKLNLHYILGDAVQIFSGQMRSSVQELREYLMPLVFPFAVLALVSRNKLVWCLFASGLLIGFLSGNNFPVSLFYHLPGIRDIRNAHFLWHYFLLSMILVSVFGFDAFLKMPNKKNKWVLIGACVVFIAMLYNYRFSGIGAIGEFNFEVKLFSLISLAIVVGVACVGSSLWMGQVVLIATSFWVVYLFVLPEQLPMVTGTRSKSLEVSRLRNLTDPSLIYSSSRPDVPSTTNEQFRKSLGTTFGESEFNSLLSLKDNSYRSRENVFEHVEGRFGIGSFPMLKSYVLFSSIPGYERLMKNKFYLFEKCFESKEPSDMAVFRQNPQGLHHMMGRGICLADKIADPKIFMGEFGVYPEAGTFTSPLPALGQIKVLDFKSDSIAVSVKTTRPALLAYTDSWYPGWVVRVDEKEKPLRKVFHTYKGVELGPGEHRVEFRFQNKIEIFLIVNMALALGIALVLAGLKIRSNQGDLKKFRL